MRQSFLRTLTEIAARDERVMFLTGDLGYMAVEVFADRFPDRFINVGVAEQNMLAVATGLADAGFIPFVYSIVPFAVLRPYEFIRNGPVQHQLPVRIVGIGGGFEYGHNGLSHYGLDDIGVMRVQPGLTIVAPADPQQTATALQATWNVAGPVYYRLGKDERRLVPGLEGRFDIAGCERIGGGDDLLVIATGSITTEAASVVQRLREAGDAVSLVVVASFSPEAGERLAAYLATARGAMTVEAHYLVGGLGSWVAELIAEAGLAVPLTRCAVRTLPVGATGSEHHMNRLNGLDAESLYTSARRMLQRTAASS